MKTREDKILQPGEYKTEAGSRMLISGPRGGISIVDFAWFDEKACYDCRPEPYDSNGYLIWTCDKCGGGSAELFKTEPSEGMIRRYNRTIKDAQQKLF